MKKNLGDTVKKAALIGTGLLFATVLAAFLALVGPSKPAYLLIGGLAGLFLFLLDDEYMMLLMAGVVYVVMGLLMYFAHLQQALWIPFGVGILLFMRIPSAYLRSPVTKARMGVPLILPVLFFVGTVVIAILVNLPPMLQVIVGGKTLLVLWSVFLLLAMFAVPFVKMRRGVGLLMPFIYVQIPFVLYQYFVIVPTRSNLGGRHGVSWDAVVGTMGGDPNGGGSSGGMAYLVTLGLLLAIALWRYGKLSFGKMASVAVGALICYTLAEVKVVVVLLPLGMLIMFRRDVLRNPAKALAGGVATLALMLGILVLYSQQHDSAKNRPHDIGQLFDQTFGYSLDTQMINYETGELGRSAAFVLWWHDGFQRDRLRGVFGYGPGASRSSSMLAVGDVASKYKFAIDRSAAAQLLWDTGLAGCLSFLFILCAGAWTALRCADRNEDPVTKATLECCAVGLALAVVMLPYSRDLIELPSLSFTMMFMLAYASQAQSLQLLERRQRRSTTMAAAAAGMPQPVPAMPSHPA